MHRAGVADLCCLVFRVRVVLPIVRSGVLLLVVNWLYLGGSGSDCDSSRNDHKDNLVPHVKCVGLKLLQDKIR